MVAGADLCTNRGIIRFCQAWIIVDESVHYRNRNGADVPCRIENHKK